MNTDNAEIQWIAEATGKLNQPRYIKNGVT